MICPIREISYNPEDDTETMECQEDVCAWYDKDEKQCAVLSIMQSLARSSPALKGIAEGLKR